MEVINQNLVSVSPNKKKRILMLGGAGYNFQEYYKPIIIGLVNKIEIEFLQGDYNLSSKIKEDLANLSNNCENFSYQIFHIPDKDDSLIKFHKNLCQLINDLSKKSFDLFTLPTDFYIWDRYLINLARSQSAKVVLIHGNTMAPELMNRYRENIGEKKSNYRRREGLFNKLFRIQFHSDGILVIALRHLRQLPIRVEKKFRRILSYYLLPLIYSKQIFPYNKDDNYRFTSGRGDAVICYDPMDIAALINIGPKIKNVSLARHPSVYYSTEQMQMETRNLLVLLTGYATELLEDQLTFLCKTIINIVGRSNLSEVHLRFHPRTGKKLLWPRKLIESLKNCGCAVILVDTNETSLVESAAQYVGIIGSVSGSLRIARYANKNAFVIGLLNTGGEIADEEWALGSAEGIVWIKAGDEISEKHLRVQQLNLENRPTVSNVLKNILAKNDE